MGKLCIFDGRIYKTSRYLPVLTVAVSVVTVSGMLSN